MEGKIALSSMGAGCILIQEDHVLLVKLNYGPAKGAWILPGGMVEVGEKPDTAAARELFEETGVKAVATNLVALRHRIEPKDRANIYFVFIAKALEEKRVSEYKLAWPMEEIQEARFWPIDEALSSNDIRPMTKSYINMYLKKQSAVWPLIELKFENKFDDNLWGPVQE